jgi:hypothetical protein
MRKFAISILGIAMLGCEGGGVTDLTHEQVSLTGGSYHEYEVAVRPYSMGSNSEIFQCSGGFTQTLSTLTAEIWRDPALGNIATYVIHRDRNYVSPGNCYPYTGGSVGISVMTPTGWEFLGSIAADASGWLTVTVPEGARILMVAVPEPGFTFNFPYANFTMNEYGIGVYETTVTGSFELAPNFVQNP